MPINKTLITFLLFFITTLSSVLCSAQEKAKSRSRPASARPVIPYNHSTLDAPPGMVYIKGGTTTIKYDQSSTDTNSIKKVSLTSFFIDKTEVTNEQYRQFVNWVIDSIAIVKYLKDDKYFINEDKSNSKESASKTSSVTPLPPTTAVLDTAAKPAAVTDTSKLAAGSSGAMMTDTSAPITKKRINWNKVSHNKIFNSKDEDTKAKLAPMMDADGNIKKDVYMFSYTYIKPITNTSKNAKRAEYKTVPVNIYPTETVWAQDMPNSQTDMYVENYFKAPPFDDYPVVGVDWVQANAYAYWRGLVGVSYSNLPSFMKYYHLVYSLPSEAQWVYAAQGFYDKIAAADSVLDSVGTLVTSDTTMTPHSDSLVAKVTPHKVIDSSKLAAKEERLAQRKAAKRGNYYLADYMKIRFAKYGGKYSKLNLNPQDSLGPFADSSAIHRDPNGMLENFKQDEGDYWEDGSALSTPVMAFAPNEFGVYNMEGNVAEWTMDAYSPAAYAFVSDLNPVLLYDADTSDADAMKRKVVRGGSFISNAKSLTPYYRDLELQNVPHCFIGFRCVMQAPEILYNNVSTRHRTVRGKPVKTKLQSLKLPEIR